MAKIAENKANGVAFFGDIDRNQHGRIGSDYPAWYFENHIDELNETIGRMERALERKNINWEDIERTREELNALKKKKELIEQSKPKLRGGDKDRIYKEYKRLGEEIRDSMFTRTEMMKGLASPHEEAKRMSEPGISANPEFVNSLNAKARRGKISRDEAARMWKILGKTLGDVPTNIEYLRRDRNTGKIDVVFPEEG